MPLSAEQRARLVHDAALYFGTSQNLGMCIGEQKPRRSVVIDSCVIRLRSSRRPTCHSISTINLNGQPR